MSPLYNPGGGGGTDATITLTDITTNDVTSTKHGWAPKAPGDTAKFLRGGATPDWAVPAGGGGGSTAFIGAKAYNSNVQSISNNSETVATLDSELFDSDGFHSTSSNTGRMTIPAGLGGKYLVVANGLFNNAAANLGRRYQQVRLNGTGIVGGQIEYVPANGTYPGGTIAVFVDLVPGDYVDMVVYQSSSASLDFGFAGTVPQGQASLQIVKLDSGKVGAGIGAKAYHSTTQSIANNTDVQCALDSEEFDTDGFHDTVTNNSRMTVPAGLGGKYLVIGNATFVPNATGQRYIRFFKNGASVHGGATNSEKGDATAGTALQLADVLDLVPGDYVELNVYQISTGSLNIGDASAAYAMSTLSIMRLDSGSTPSGLVLLEQHAAASSSSLDFTSFISADYDTYLIEGIDLSPASNAVDLLLQIGTGGGPTWDTGSTYAWGMLGINNAGSTVTDNGGSSPTGAKIAKSLSNDSGYGFCAFSLTATNLQSTAHRKSFHGTVQYVNTAVPSIYFSSLGVQWETTATAVTGLRFKMSSGNIASGTIRIYGLAK